jgi:hypothetical protein
MNDHYVDVDALPPSTGQNLSRTVFEYHYLRRRLLKFHSADQRDIVAIDAVMRKLDEMRGALRATQPPLGARALTHATAHAYR